MGINHISMHFRHHNIENKADDISKLNFRIRANDWFLAELHVKWLYDANLIVPLLLKKRTNYPCKQINAVTN